MSEARFVRATVELTPYLVRLSLSLAWTYFTLNWRVRKTRRAFEKQLTAQGMSKQDAEQLSAFLDDFKNNVTNTVKRGLTSGGFG
jgi:hypothetical protein